MKIKKYLGSIICFLIAALIGMGDFIVFTNNETRADLKSRIIFLLVAMVFVGFGEFFLVKALPEKYKKIKYLFIVQQAGTVAILLLSLFLLNSGGILA